MAKVKATKTKKAKTESELTWKDLEIGCMVTEPANAAQYETGTWRSQRPKRWTTLSITYNMPTRGFPA
jgi:hypothetical protein